MHNATWDNRFSPLQRGSSRRRRRGGRSQSQTAFLCKACLSQELRLLAVENPGHDLKIRRRQSADIVFADVCRRLVVPLAHEFHKRKPSLDLLLPGATIGKDQELVRDIALMN